MTSWILFGFMSAGAAAPHPRESPAPLLLSEVLSEALQANPELREAEAKAASQSEQALPAGAYADPVLSIEAMNYPADTLQAGELGMTGNQLAFSQAIPFPGKLSLQRRAAEAMAAAEAERARDRRLTLIRDVKSAFHALLLAHERLAILEEERELLRQLLAVSREHYAVGRIPQAEVLALQLEEASVLDERIRMESEIVSRQGELHHRMGRADHSRFHLGRPAAPKRAGFDFALNPEGEVMARVFARNSGLAAQGKELEAAERELARAKMGYLPDFELRVAGTFREASPGDRGAPLLSAMVGATLPLWAWSRQGPEIRASRAMATRAEAALDAARAELFHRTHEVYSRLKEADERVRLFETGMLPLARQAVGSARAGYLTRKVDFQVLLQSIQRRFQAEASYRESLAALATRRAELDALLGEEGRE